MLTEDGNMDILDRIHEFRYRMSFVSSRDLVGLSFDLIYEYVSFNNRKNRDAWHARLKKERKLVDEQYGRNDPSRCVYQDLAEAIDLLFDSIKFREDRAAAAEQQQAAATQQVQPILPSGNLNNGAIGQQQAATQKLQPSIPSRNLIDGAIGQQQAAATQQLQPTILASNSPLTDGVIAVKEEPEDIDDNLVSEMDLLARAPTALINSREDTAAAQLARSVRTARNEDTIEGAIAVKEELIDHTSNRRSPVNSALSVRKARSIGEPTTRIPARPITQKRNGSTTKTSKTATDKTAKSTSRTARPTSTKKRVSFAALPTKPATAKNTAKKDRKEAAIFACPKPGCNVSRPNKGAMAFHLRDIHNESPYECGPCKLKFAKLTHLVSHRNEVHGKKK